MFYNIVDSTKCYSRTLTTCYSGRDSDYELLYHIKADQDMPIDLRLGPVKVCIFK